MSGGKLQCETGEVRTGLAKGSTNTEYLDSAQCVNTAWRDTDAKGRRISNQSCGGYFQFCAKTGGCRKAAASLNSSPSRLPHLRD